MTQDAGYTLVEMLAALAVIGLAFGGLSAGVNILARHQTSATSRIVNSEDIGAAQAEFEVALGDVKTADIQAGASRRLEILCPRGERCETPAQGKLVSVIRTGSDRVAVVAAVGHDFGYMTTSGLVRRWAPVGDDQLMAVVLMKARTDAPVAVMKLRQEQAFSCEYDVVIAACRVSTP